MFLHVFNSESEAAVTVGYKQQLEIYVQDEEGEDARRQKKAMTRSDEKIMYTATLKA